MISISHLTNSDKGRLVLHNNGMSEETVQIAGWNHARVFANGKGYGRWNTYGKYSWSGKAIDPINLSFIGENIKVTKKGHL